MSRPNFDGTYWASIPLPTASDILNENVVKKIDPNDLYYDPIISKNKPVEDNHHITLLLGLPEFIDEKTADVISTTPSFQFKVDGLGFFTNPPKMIEGQERCWDVLYAIPDVALECSNLHNFLCQNYNLKWHFEEYKPHITVAFLKYGTAQKYLQLLKDHPISLQANEVQWKKFRDKKALTRRLFLK